MSRLELILSAVYLLALYQHPCEARTWLVKLDRSGDAPTIQAAIDSARAGDDVLVSVGRYTWTSESASGESMIHLKPDIWLHGQSVASSTTLDAETRGRVIQCDNAGGNIRIENLTITNGRAGSSASERHGGGVNASGDSSPRLLSCIVKGNSATFGGGVYCNIASIEQCSFVDNHVGGSEEPVMGGGVYCGSASISNSTFSRNSADTGGGLGDAHGGAVACESSMITACTFEDNLARSGCTATGGAIDERGVASINSCFFKSNVADASGCLGSGGAVKTYAQGGAISNCAFAGNAARNHYQGQGGAGGGVHSDGPCNIEGCIFVGNSAQGTGDAPGDGGAIVCGVGSTVDSCTLLRNAATDIVGIQGTGGIVIAGGEVRLTILQETSSGIACSGSAMWTCCDLFGNPFGDQICGIDGGGNFSMDPRFCAVDPESSLNFALRADSPCAPANHPAGSENCSLVGARPVGCSITATQLGTWTNVKRLFR